MENLLSHLKKDSEGNYFIQYVAMFTATLGTVSSGMHYGWPSVTLPQLLDKNSTIPVTSEEGSWIAVMLLLGNICGSMLGVLILDVIGRKRVILLSCIPSLIAWITIAYTKSVGIIILARFLAGISDGFTFCGLPTYLGEIADPKIRGALGSSVVVTLIFGILLINIIGSYLTIKTTALVALVVPVLCLLTFVWLPESPYYLIMKGNMEQARKNLKTLKSTDNVEGDLKRITKAIKEQGKDTGRCLDLFTVKGNRKALGIALILRTAQQFSGISAILFYAQIIFQEAGNSGRISASEASMIYFAVQFVMCVCCSTVVDRAGRRPLLIISTIGAGIALFAEGSYFYALNRLNMDLSNLTWIPLVALVGFAMAFSLGLQTIPTLMLGELFPINVKAFAVGLVGVYFSTTIATVSKLFQITKDNFGLHVPFYCFFVACVLGLIFIMLFVPETKGKTLKEIQDELKGNTSEDDSRSTELTEKVKMISIS